MNKTPVDMESVIAREEESIKEVMKTIDLNGLRLAVIVNKTKEVVGLVVDGDIRTAIIQGADISQPINTIMNKNPVVIKKEDIAKPEKASSAVIEVLKRKSEFIPVINENNVFVDLAHFSEIDKGIKTKYVTKKLCSEFVQRVLVVGGAGYIGSVLCRKLLDKGYKVRALDIFMFGEEPIVELFQNKNFDYIRGDVRNIETISKALSGVDAVIHLAAIVGDPACKELPTNTIETNYLATRALAEACKYHQINKFIFASTCSVYGIGSEKLDENSPLNPVSLYARSKIKSEKALLSMIDDNFSPCMMRMGTIYGLSPRMRFDLVVNTFAKKAVLDKEIILFGGEQFRPLVHVEDVAEAFVKTIEAPMEKIKGEIFNVGSDEQNYRIKEVAEMIKKIMPETAVNISSGEQDIRDYIVDFTKIKNVLGFDPAREVEESITEIRDAILSKKIANPDDSKHYNIE